MKKRALFLLLLSFVFLSCGKKDEFTEFGEEYVPGYDDNRSEIKGNALDGTQLYVSGFYVNCLDFETGESYPLCSKPNCNHDTEDCNAYLPMASICTYQDQLIATDDSGGFIYNLRKDGSGKEELGMFFKMEDYAGGSSARPPIAHRGYIYVGYSLYMEEEAVSRLARMPVSGGEQEIIFETSLPIERAERGTFGIASLNGIGSKIYFEFHDHDISTFYCYNTKNRKLSQIHEGERKWISYPADDGNWYWMTTDGVYRWNPETDEEHCLYTFANDPMETGRWLRFYNGGFILQTENDHSMLVFYNWEGQEVAKKGLTVPNPELFFIDGHFDNYLVCTYSQGQGKPYAYAILDTNKLADPNLEWMIFDSLCD